MDPATLALINLVAKVGIDAAIALLERPIVSIDDAIAALKRAKEKSLADYIAQDQLEAAWRRAMPGSPATPPPEPPVPENPA